MLVRGLYMTSLEHKQEMDNIKMWLHTGAISYNRAAEMAKPHLDAMNEKAKEIAKRCGVKPKIISFSAYMR